MKADTDVMEGVRFGVLVALDRHRVRRDLAVRRVSDQRRDGGGRRHRRDRRAGNLRRDRRRDLQACWRRRRTQGRRVIEQVTSHKSQSSRAKGQFERADRRKAQGGTRGRHRDIVGHLLSRRRSRRAGVLRVRHPRSRGERHLRGSLLPAVAPAAADSAPSSAICSRSSPPPAAAGAGHPADASRCRQWTAWTRCARSRRRWRTTTLRSTTRRLRRSYRKAVRLTAQIGTVVAAWGRLQAGGGVVEPDPAMGHAANFLYMLTGERPNAAGDPGIRRRADPARRSRAQRLDVCRTRRGGDADRHLLGSRCGHRHAQGPAARRRQRRRDADAARARRDGGARACRRGDPREAGAQGEDSRVRAPRVPHRRSARDAPAADVARSRQARRAAPPGSTCRSASRRSSRARRS